MNALQRLIQRYLDATGETQADIVRRGGLPRQTVSWILRSSNASAQQVKPETLDKLAVGMSMDPRRVHLAGAQAAGYDVEETAAGDEDRFVVLSAMVRTLDPPRRREVEQRAAQLMRDMRAAEDSER